MEHPDEALVLFSFGKEPLLDCSHYGFF